MSNFQRVGNETIHLKTVPLLQKVFEDAANKVNFKIIFI